MFIAQEVWSIADVSSISPSLEQEYTANRPFHGFRRHLGE